MQLQPRPQAITPPGYIQSNLSSKNPVDIDMASALFNVARKEIRGAYRDEAMRTPTL